MKYHETNQTWLFNSRPYAHADLHDDGKGHVQNSLGVQLARLGI